MNICWENLYPKPYYQKVVIQVYIEDSFLDKNSNLDGQNSVYIDKLTALIELF
jgi:hypothetical protein